MNSKSAIGAQLYTLREYTKTPPDIAKTLARVKKIGYDAVQVSAFGPINPAELGKILRNEGLACAATHVPLARMKNETQAVIDEHRMWDCHYTAIGGLFPKDATAPHYVDFASDYNATAKKFAGSGVEVGYHNHSHELARFGETTALAMLIEKLDPSIWFEIDTYWITHGGGDPAAWIRKVTGRIPCVHLKDMAIKPDRTQYMAEVGVGNLNWREILKACKEAGVKWYLVEQDECYRDPFDSLETSLKNLNQMGLD